MLSRGWSRLVFLPLVFHLTLPQHRQGLPKLRGRILKSFVL